MKNKIYAAGIADRNGDWVWQGTVVAENQTSAKKMLTEFKKKLKLVGRSEVASLFGDVYTERSKGVSESTYLF